MNDKIRSEHFNNIVILSPPADNPVQSSPIEANSSNLKSLLMRIAVYAAGSTAIVTIIYLIYSKTEGSSITDAGAIVASIITASTSFLATKLDSIRSSKEAAGEKERLEKLLIDQELANREHQHNLASLKEAHESKLAALGRDHKSNLSSIKIANDNRAEDARRKHDELLSELKRNQKDSLAESERQHKSELAAEKRSHELELQRLIEAGGAEAEKRKIRTERHNRLQEDLDRSATIFIEHLNDFKDVVSSAPNITASFDLISRAMIAFSRLASMQKQVSEISLKVKNKHRIELETYIKFLTLVSLDLTRKTQPTDNGDYAGVMQTYEATISKIGRRISWLVRAHRELPTAKIQESYIEIYGRVEKFLSKLDLSALNDSRQIA